MSTLQVTTIQSNSTTAPPTIQNSAGTEYGTFCRAWVNFNGTSTVSIRGSFNVSFITDNGTGDYTVNITNALADANYATVISSGAANTAMTNVNSSNTSAAAKTTSANRINTWFGSALADFFDVNVSIFR